MTLMIGYFMFSLFAFMQKHLKRLIRTPFNCMRCFNCARYVRLVNGLYDCFMFLIAFTLCITTSKSLNYVVSA